MSPVPPVPLSRPVASSTAQCGYETRPPGHLLFADPRSFSDTTDTCDTTDTTDTTLIGSLFFRIRVAHAQTACPPPAPGRDKSRPTDGLLSRDVQRANVGRQSHRCQS